MQGDSGVFIGKIVVVKSCYCRKRQETCTTYEGAFELPEGDICCFVSNRVLVEDAQYRLVRSTPYQIPDIGQVIRIFKAKRIERG